MRNKASKNSLLLFSWILIFSSCTKVVELDLKEFDIKIVIEGGVVDGSAINTITLTKNINFDQSNVFPNVTGAIVEISDDAGNSETLTETSPGVYQTTTLTGVQGRTYFLTISADGKNYTAQSTMPYKVNFDSLVVQNSLGFQGDSVADIKPWYQDPVGIKNYYRYVRYLNGTRYKGSISVNDFFNDGAYSTLPLPFQDDGFKVNSNDTLMIEMQCVDENIDLYFRSKQQTISGMSGAPANPETNIVGGALGYFSAYTSQSRKIKIP